MPTWVNWAVIVMALYGLHRLGLWAERRGWIYYRPRRGGTNAIADAAFELQTVMKPSTQHVREAQRREPSTEDEDGSAHGREPIDGGETR